ncbi:hypothetical protein VTJ04DRAFT_1794 [Mycothermus thermophilus]|uniref:uncharacterized protein n=1 Tax=Humicola insolens TaxID=85995 RepID=UPI003743C509
MPGDPHACANFRTWLDTDEIEGYSFRILSRSDKAKGGVQIETEPDYDENDGRATIGGMVEINGELYGLTVRHAFLMGQPVNNDMDPTTPRDGSENATGFGTSPKFLFDSDFEDDESDYDDPEWISWKMNIKSNDHAEGFVEEDLNSDGPVEDEDETLEGFVEGDGFTEDDGFVDHEIPEPFAEYKDNNLEGFLEGEGARDEDASRYQHQHTWAEAPRPCSLRPNLLFSITPKDAYQTGLVFTL